MAILVYKLTCTVSGKSYVGITARALHTRWLEHCDRARQGVRNSRLYDALRKYGPDSFTREVIATADTQDEARQYERAMIRSFDTYQNGYNANEGGCGWLDVPEEVRRKIGAAQLGKVITSECRAKMSAAKSGDPACAVHLGAHARKGSENPRSISAVIGFPDGSIRRVRGLRAFCRSVGIDIYKLKKRGVAKGHVLLHRFAPTTPADAVA